MNVSPDAGRHVSVSSVVMLLALAVTGCQREPPHTAQDARSDTAAGERIRADIRVLAADDMQGREAGTAGHRRAADYVASRFADIGLEPLGDDGGYLQSVPLLETRLVPGSASLVLSRGGRSVELDAGADYLRAGGFGDTADAVTAPLLFAGFGVQAPEYGHDDFAGVDASGKLLVLFSGAPPGFASDERAFYSSSDGKQHLAVALGAVGILTVRTPVDQQRLTWPRLQAAYGKASLRWLDADGRPHDAYPALRGDAMLSESGARTLFELAGQDLAALFAHHGNGATGALELGVTASMRRASVQQRTASPNVLAVLPGRDLAGEYLLMTAHLDGLGIAAAGHDRVYNGAYDNAAGVATLLEAARAMAASAPRRSVIFAAVTAEEKGLRGSDYLAHHPPVPIGSIVANINVDMPFLGYPPADVEGFGVEHSTLTDALAKAAAETGLALSPDPRPELVRLIRSDQFSFVKKGVPGLNLQPGNASSDPAADGGALRARFLRDHYHQPTDDLALPYSNEAATRFARLVASFALQVANDDARPRWHDGDFFGDRYAGTPPPGQ